MCIKASCVFASAGKAGNRRAHINGRWGPSQRQRLYCLKCTQWPPHTVFLGCVHKVRCSHCLGNLSNIFLIRTAGQTYAQTGYVQSQGSLIETSKLTISVSAQVPAYGCVSVGRTLYKVRTHSTTSHIVMTSALISCPGEHA